MFGRLDTAHDRRHAHSYKRLFPTGSTVLPQEKELSECRIP